MAAVQQAYEQVVMPALPVGGKVFFMGDSAGGSKALGLAQRLLPGGPGAGLRQADGLLLLAPWVDTSCSQPGALETSKIDPMLDIPGAYEGGRWYAGSTILDEYTCKGREEGEAMRDRRVSPLYGPMQGLPGIALWVGTRDILIHDARALKAKLPAGVLRYYHEEEGAFHVYQAAPSVVPEARRAVEDMARVIRGWK
jgi:acetyl esterase/lipase